MVRRKGSGQINLHALIATLQQTGKTNPEAEFEDQVVSILKRHGPLTANEVHRYLKGRSTPEIARILETLAQHGVLTASDTQRKTKRYFVVGSNRSTGEEENRSKDVSTSTVAGERSNQDAAVSDTPVLPFSSSSASSPRVANESQIEQAYRMLQLKGPDRARRYMNAAAGFSAFPVELQRAVASQNQESP